MNKWTTIQYLILNEHHHTLTTSSRNSYLISRHRTLNLRSFNVSDTDLAKRHRQASSPLPITDTIPDLLSEFTAADGKSATTLRFSALR